MVLVYDFAVQLPRLTAVKGFNPTHHCPYVTSRLSRHYPTPWRGIFSFLILNEYLWKSRNHSQLFFHNLKQRPSCGTSDSDRTSQPSKCEHGNEVCRAQRALKPKMGTPQSNGHLPDIAVTMATKGQEGAGAGKMTVFRRSLCDTENLHVCRVL